jgi:cytoskeletal protein CcmA (bactofilin family)
MIGKKPGIGSAGEETTSVIGEGSVFDGTMEITGNLRVDGTFKGNLDISEGLVVGKKGTVEADVKTRSAVIAGSIRGNLNAADKITLQSGSHLEGEMVTSKLVIEEGVSFQGSCNTSTNSPAKGNAPRAGREKGETTSEDSEEIAEVAQEIASK